MSLAVAFHERLEDIGAAAWNTLIARCPDSGIFQSYEWIDAWLRTVGDEIARPLIVTAHESDRLVGLAPLWRGTEPDAPGTASMARFLGAWHSDYLTFPSIDGSPRVLEALLDGVDRALPPGEALELFEIPAVSALAKCLEQRARGNRGIWLNDDTPCPRLQLSGNAAGIAQVLAKDSLRRHEKRLRALGDVGVAHLTDIGAIDPLLDEFFEQHVRRWAGTKSPSLFAHDRNRRFYREALRGLAGRQAVVFSVVSLAGRPVAQHFGLRSRNDLLWYKPTFDIELARAGPGEVLIGTLIEYARDQQFDALDFTRGDEAFKQRFATATRFNRSFVWYRGAWNRARAGIARTARAQARRLRATLLRGRH